MMVLKFLLLPLISVFYNLDVYCYKSFRIPRGFVKIKGGKMYKKDKNANNSGIVNIEPFFVSPFKVTNRDYKNVMVYAKKNKLTESFNILVPDYSKISDSIKNYNLEPSAFLNYFENYNDYPIVGLTYRQIIEFINVKSKMDGVRYRLLTPDEYDFIAYEVENIINDRGNLEIIQRDSFDETKKKRIEFINDVSKQDGALNKDKKGRCGNTCRKKKKVNNKVKVNKKLVYRFFDYFNLRDSNFTNPYEKIFFNKVNKYEPNIFGVYDIVGNTLEITSANKTVCFDLDEASTNIFTLCGGSCFDFYDLVKVENKQTDRYDDVRCDSGFRLVVEVER